jgi:hypothetical protein
MPSHLTDRDKELCRLREQCGWSFSRLADHFDISPDNVRRIWQKGEEFKKWPRFRRLLPVRVQNVLLNKFNQDESIFDNPERIIAETSVRDLMQNCKNAGIYTVSDIANALTQIGCPPPREWFRYGREGESANSDPVKVFFEPRKRKLMDDNYT